MMREDLRMELLIAVAEVAWNLIEDGIPDDTAISDAMSDYYRIPLQAVSGWTLTLVGVCPAALFPRGQRWQFEADVFQFIRGEWHDVGGLVSKN